MKTVTDQDKILAFKGEAREKLFAGVTKLADAVTTTLGPKGRNVAIQRQWGLPIVVHDGVTVAREVGDSDPLVLIGINLVKEAAQKTNTEAGDGTTTATLLAYEIVKRGMKLLDEGVNPMVLRDEIYSYLPGLLEMVEKISEDVKDKTQIERVAYISSADEEVGRLVAEAVEEVGEDGLVTVEENNSSQTEVETTEGMEINRGWIAPHFVTNEQRLEAVIENPAILVVDQKISLAKEIVPLLEAMAAVTKDIVIIAQDVSGDALATMISNKMKGNVNALAVQGPSHGDREGALADIATITGGVVIDENTQINLDKIEDFIGRADKVVSGRGSTVIVNGHGEKKDVENKIKSLKEQIKNEKSEFEQEKMQQRLAKLSTGVAVIKVGATTQIDMREKVERVKDAIGAATAAREEGIIPGGGVAFLMLQDVVDNKTKGGEILHAALESPIRKLISNAGESEKVANDAIASARKSKGKEGYEVRSGKVVDLSKEGIIDPAKVIRLALENAIGVGTSILTTDCLITYDQRELLEINK